MKLVKMLEADLIPTLLGNGNICAKCSDLIANCLACSNNVTCVRCFAGNETDNLLN